MTYVPKYFEVQAARSGYGPRFTLRDLSRAKFCMMFSACSNNLTTSEDYRRLAQAGALVFIQGHNAESGWFMLEMWGEMDASLGVIQYLEEKLDNAALLEDYETMLRDGWFDNHYPDTATGNPELPSMYDMDATSSEEECP